MLSDHDLLALNRAVERINNEFYDRFDPFNTRYPEFYKRFDSNEDFQVALDHLPGTGTLVRWMGLVIYRSVDWLRPRNEEDDLEGWYYDHLSEQVSYAAQYASMCTKDGATVCEAVQERRRQDLKWGGQNHPNTRKGILTKDYRQLYMNRVREIYEGAHRSGNLTWMDVLLEEVAEVAEEADLGYSQNLYEELVQVAAVALQWAEKVRPECSG